MTADILPSSVISRNGEIPLSLSMCALLRRAVNGIIDGMNFRKIAVLMGGVSNEREISLISGANVANALARLDGVEVVSVRLDKSELPPLPEGTDACFIALHGGWGENGGVQRALDALKVPYTGPGADACELAMDKIATKKVLEKAGVPTAAWREVRCGDNSPNSLGFPVVVKAPRDGSSVGVYKCDSEAEYQEALAKAWKIDADAFGGPGTAIAEAFVDGREATVGVLGGKALPAIEIVAAGGWYGYEEKYNSEETRYPFIKGEPELEAELARVAIDAYRACGCRGVTRVDFRIDREGHPLVLELNTSPGMTGHSLVPKAAAESGLDFPRLCAAILDEAAFG